MATAISGDGYIVCGVVGETPRRHPGAVATGRGDDGHPCAGNAHRARRGQGRASEGRHEAFGQTARRRDEEPCRQEHNAKEDGDEEDQRVATADSLIGLAEGAARTPCDWMRRGVLGSSPSRRDAAPACEHGAIGLAYVVGRELESYPQVQNGMPIAPAEVGISPCCVV